MSKSGKKATKTRYAELMAELGEEGEEEDSPLLEFPELISHEYLIGDFFALGRIAGGGMSASPLSYQEIESWTRLTFVELTCWEVMALHTMSVAYVNQIEPASDEKCPPPHVAEVEPTPEVRVKVDHFFRGLALARKDAKTSFKT